MILVDSEAEDDLTNQNQLKQECIPVGCIPTAAVAATRCQYQGDGSLPPEWGLPPGE